METRERGTQNGVWSRQARQGNKKYTRIEKREGTLTRFDSVLVFGFTVLRSNVKYNLLQIKLDLQ